MTDTMVLIGDQIKKLPQAQQLGVLSGVFGARALAGGSNIVESIQDVREFRTVLENAAGTSEKTAEIMRKSLGNQFKALGSAATEMGFKFLSAFDKKGKGAILRLTEVIRRVDVQPFIEGVKTAARVVSSLVKAIKPIVPILPVLIGGMIAYSAAIKIQAFLAFITVIKTMTASMGLLNIVMTANPVGAVIVGITALIAVGILLYKNWDLINERFGKYISVAKVVAAFSPFGMIIAGTFLFIKNLDKILPVLKFIGAGVVNVFGFIGQALIGTAKLIRQMFIDPIVSGILFIIKSVAKLGSKIGKRLGFDTSGLTTIVKDLESIRASIKADAGKNPFDFKTLVKMPKLFPEQSATVKHTVEARAAELGGMGSTAPDKNVFNIKTPPAPTAGPVAAVPPHLRAKAPVEAGKAPEPQAPQAPVAPNKTEVEARQSVGISGKIQVAGLPKESTGQIKTDQRGSKINLEMLGANP